MLIAKIIKAPMKNIFASVIKINEIKEQMQFRNRKTKEGVVIMMRSTGIVRKVDELGRVVIPIELRRSLKIDEKDPLEIYADGEKIFLAQYKPACIFCGSTTDVVHFKGKNICKSCLKSAKEFASNSTAS